MAKVLLFYKYTEFTYPKRIYKWQLKVCQELNLTGRIIIAHEGINGTLAGADKAIERYKTIVRQHPQLIDMDIKESDGDDNCFAKLRVVVKNEIVNLRQPHAAHINNTGKHLSVQQTHELLNNRPDDLIILDARNQVESAIGAFENAIKPEIKHFRELPTYIDAHLDMFKDKQVLMYCTGGIRCERASAYLKEKGIAKEVYQIEGGIHRYTEQYPDGHFRGKNYVFDGRIAVKITDDILGHCALCSIPHDEYNNCSNAQCNKHYIGCTQCLQRYNRCCSARCQELLTQGKVTMRPAINKACSTTQIAGR